MSFDPEFISEAVMSGEDEYSIDLSERLITAPVFDHARMLQRELVQTRLPKDRLAEAFNHISREFITELDAEGNEQGLLGKKMILRGEGVEIPVLSADLAKGLGLISVQDNFEIGDESLEKNFAASEVRGGFGGFTVRFMKDPESGDDDDKALYIPILAPQVSEVTVNMPNAYMNLFSTGLFGITQISFEEDEARDEQFVMIQGLYDLCPGYEAEINLITRAFLEDQPDGSQLRCVEHHVGKLMDAHAEAGDDWRLQFEHEMVNFIESFVKVGRRASIIASRWLLFPKDKDAELYDTIQVAKGKVAGVVFRPSTAVSNGKLSFNESKSRLYLALDCNDQRPYVPLASIEEFTLL